MREIDTVIEQTLMNSLESTPTCVHSEIARVSFFRLIHLGGALGGIVVGQRWRINVAVLQDMAGVS
jgi:hypothetical protein